MSSTWFSGSGRPMITGNESHGDMYLDTINCDVYSFDINHVSWDLVITSCAWDNEYPKLKITQEDDLTFIIENVNLQNKEVYKWLMITDFEYEIISDTVVLDHTLKIKFADTSGSVAFKLSWM